MPRIILTGATGMIGGAIIRKCVERGYDITCIVRGSSPRIKNIPQSGRVHIVECDACDYESLVLDGSYDAFFHLAWAKTSVGGRDDVDCQLQNVRYTLDAVRLAKRCGCSVFIGAGSQAEYGIKDGVLAGNMPVNPESGYGIAKYVAGKLSSLLCGQLGIRFNWLRILSVYGKNDGENTLISYCIRELKAGRSLELTKCEQMWDYLNCDDAASAFLAVAEKGVGGKAYPLGSGQGRRLSEYIEDIQQIINPSVPILFGRKPYYPHQPMYLVADISELSEDTGWGPRIPFTDGIKRLVAEDAFGG